MSELQCIEDLFVEMYEEILIQRIPIPSSDKQPMTSFYNLLVQGQRITVNQSNFILKLLKKYNSKNIDYDNIQWKRDFRTIDMSRKAFVEQDENNNFWIGLKFPYQLKNIVEKDIIGNGTSYYGENKWDKDRRVRLLKLLDYNIIQIYEFIKQNQFEIEESFFTALSAVEDIWQSSDLILPKCRVANNNVTLLNAPRDAEIYFNQTATGEKNNDLFLAKTMGYILEESSTTAIEKIASSNTNSFWIKSFKEFFDLTESINGTVAIMLDRNVEYLDWLKVFKNSLISYGIEKNNVCVCFRESNKENKGFNEWIKENNFNGKIENQKYLIFSAKPPKWLFSKEKSVKIIATNNLFLPNNHTARSWIDNHPCTIYLGNVKPSLRDREIVEL